MPAVPLPISVFTVEDWFNGLYTATMLGTLWVITFSRHCEGRRKRWPAALVLVMYICSTMHAALQWFFYASAINNNEDTNGVMLITALTNLAPWLEATGDAFFCLNIFIADCTFIWRCWVIWQRRWLVVIIPIFATIAGVVLAGFVIGTQVLALQSDVTFVVVDRTHKFVTLASAYFALSISTSLLTTVLIIGRILYVQYTARKLGVKTSTYNDVIEILVESAALYAATLLTFVVLNSKHNINYYYAQDIHAQVAGFAPTLIILRVAAGKARKDEEWSTKLESVRFADPGDTTSTSAPTRDAELGLKVSDSMLAQFTSGLDTSGSELEVVRT